MFETVPTPNNDPHLMRLVRVMVVRSFCVQGRPLEPGTMVELPRYVAADMIALRKAEMLNP